MKTFFPPFSCGFINLMSFNQVRFSVKMKFYLTVRRQNTKIYCWVPITHFYLERATVDLNERGVVAGLFFRLNQCLTIR